MYYHFCPLKEIKSKSSDTKHPRIAIVIRKSSRQSQQQQRYTNADLKISLYVQAHVKIIP